MSRRGGRHGQRSSWVLRIFNNAHKTQMVTDKIQKHPRAELTTKVNKKALVPSKINEFYSLAFQFGRGPPLYHSPPLRTNIPSHRVGPT